MLLALLLVAFQDPVELTIQSDEGEPVPGLTVRVTSPQAKAKAITDMEGRVTLKPIDGAAFLRVNEKGYTPIAIPWSPELHGSTITIHRRATLEGYVSHEDGSELRTMVILTARWHEDIGSARKEVERSTLAAGGQLFRLEDLPHGEVTVSGRVLPLGTPLVTEVVQLDSGANRFDLRYNGPDINSSLLLAVRAPKFGVALSSTQLEVRSSDGTSKKIGVPVSNTINELLVTDLGAPPYEIESLDERLTAGVVHAPRPGRRVKVDLEPTGSLDFLLLDEDGEPVTDATIRWASDRNHTVDLHQGPIDGPLHLEPVLKIDGAILIVERFGSFTQHFPLDQVKGELRLARFGDLIVQVLDEGGSPVQGVLCTLGLGGIRVHHRPGQVTDGHGIARFEELPPGELYVRAEFHDGVITQERAFIDGDTRVYLPRPQLGFIQLSTVKVERKLADRFPTNASLKFTSPTSGMSSTHLLSPGNRIQREVSLVAGTYEAELRLGQRKNRRVYPLGQVELRGGEGTDFEIDWSQFYPLKVDFQVTLGGETVDPILVKGSNWSKSTTRQVYLFPGTHELTLQATDGSWKRDVTLTVEPGVDRVFELKLD